MKASRFFLLAWICAGSAGLPTACGSDDEKVCTPGDTRACFGPGRCEGAQVCTADGSGFGTCECGNDGGSGTGGGGTGGSGGTAGSGGGGTGGGGTGGSGATDAAAGSDGSAGTAGADGGPCDPVTGGACPSGQKCGWLIDETTPVVVGHTGCQPLLGNRAPGQSCARNETRNSDDCGPGAYCGSATCAKVCDMTAGCGQGFECERTNIHEDRPNVGLCFEVCDPVAQDCALATDGCYFGRCARAGTQTHCTGVGGLECTPGTECLPVNTTDFACLPYCNTQAPACGTNETCTLLSTLIGVPGPFAVCVPN